MKPYKILPAMANPLGFPQPSPHLFLGTHKNTQLEKNNDVPRQDAGLKK